MESFAICSLASRNFSRLNLIVASTLKKLSTKMFTLDTLSTSLYLQGMMLKISASFVVELTLFASSKVFSEIASGESSIFRMFVRKYIMIWSGWPSHDVTYRLFSDRVYCNFFIRYLVKGCIRNVINSVFFTVSCG